MKHTLIVAAALCLGASAAYAQAASTTTDPAVGSATVQIVTPITLAHASDAALNFGRVVPTAAGTVVVPPTSVAGAGVFTGVTQATGGDATTADHFTVTNNVEDELAYNVNLPDTITLSDNSTTHANLIVSDLTESAGPDSSASDFYVGGTLTIPQDQPAGTYTGTYEVTITY